MRNYIEKLNSDDGVTLVELLAAIAILSIIVTAFLAFFVQAGKTNNTTDEINQATFLAQSRMEEITRLSPDNLTEAGNLPDEVDVFTITTAIDGPKEGTSLYQIIVKVYKGGKLHAQMETWLPFKESPN